MSEVVRSIIDRIRSSINYHRYAKRYRVQLPVTVAVHTRATKTPSIIGHTHDISSSGVAIIVPSIRIGSHYLTGEDRRLAITIQLPSDQSSSLLQMTALPVRYFTFEENSEIDKHYLIGARILEMSDEDRAAFEAFLRKLK